MKYFQFASDDTTFFSFNMSIFSTNQFITDCATISSSHLSDLSRQTNNVDKSYLEPLCDFIEIEWTDN